MLQLPDELIEHILQLAVPVDYSWTTYTQLQAFLRSTCLVSRRFRDIAQPLLHQVYKLEHRSPAETQSKVDFPLDRARLQLRVLVVMGCKPDEEFSQCEGLTDVRLCETEGEMSLSWLAGLPNLRRLVLEYVEIAAFVPLPDLVELSCDGVSVQDLATFLDITTFPSLRLLAFPEYDLNSRPIPQPLFLQQLDAFFDDDTAFTAARTTPTTPWNGMTPPVLVDTLDFERDAREADPARQFLFRTASHVRLTPMTIHISSEDQRHYIEVIKLLVDQLALFPAGTSNLTTRLFYLPTVYRPTASQPEPLAEATKKFMAICAERGISVDFEDADRDITASLVSHKFWAYAKELKAEKKQD